MQMWLFLDMVRGANDMGLAFDPECPLTHDIAAEVSQVAQQAEANGLVYWFSGDEENQAGWILRRSV